MRRKIIIASIFSILMLTVPLLGCSSKNSGTSTPTTPTQYWYESYWYEGSDGMIQTYNIGRLQEIVPFEIVFPTYLPDDLKALPPVLIKSTKFEADLYVEILYKSIDGSAEVSIDEINSIYEWVPNPKVEYIYFDIEGIRVLEQKIYDYFTLSRQQMMELRLNYCWNHDNLSFDVDVTGYDKTEARKIVESMIKQ